MSVPLHSDPRAVSLGAFCRGCNREIVWVTMDSGKRMPCDPDLVRGDWKATLVVVYRPKVAGGFGDPVGGVVAKAPSTMTGRVSHFATCPQAGEFRTRGLPTP